MTQCSRQLHDCDRVSARAETDKRATSPSRRVDAARAPVPHARNICISPVEIYDLEPFLRDFCNRGAPLSNLPVGDIIKLVVLKRNERSEFL